MHELSLHHEIIVEKPPPAEDCNIPTDEAAICKLVLAVACEGCESGKRYCGGRDTCITGWRRCESGISGCDGCES